MRTIKIQRGVGCVLNITADHVQSFVVDQYDPTPGQESKDIEFYGAEEFANLKRDAIVVEITMLLQQDPVRLYGDHARSFLRQWKEIDK